MDRRLAQGALDTPGAPLTASWRGWFPGLVVGLGFVALAALVYDASGPVRYYNHFVWQALAFLDGRAQIDYPVFGPYGYSNDWFQDVMPVPGPNGEAYGYGLLPFPPLPAVVLMPFAALWGLATDQRAINVLLAAADVGLCWWMLGRLPVSVPIRLAATIFFAFGTVFWYSAQLGTTWYLAHTVALALLFAAVGLAIGGDPEAAGEDHRPPDSPIDDVLDAIHFRSWPLDGRQLLAGFLFGLACTSRLTIAFGAPFFVLVGSGGSWLRRAASAGLGAALPIGALVLFNVVSTGHVVNPAYDYLYHVEADFWPGLHYHSEWAIEDPRYLPQNLGIMLLEPPVLFPTRAPSAITVDTTPFCVTTQARALFDAQCPIAVPNDVGLSLLLASPAYLLAIPALRLVRRSRLVAGAAAAVLVIAIVNLMHFSQGWVQFGYRFSLDFVPFALVLVALGMARRGRLGLLAATLLLASIAVNFWGVTWGNLLGW